MSVRVIDSKMLVELSLSLPKPAWKVRSSVRRGRRGRWIESLRCYVFTPRMGDEILKGDVFEWMITNEELRDLLSVLKCISPGEYEAVRGLVRAIGPDDYVRWHQVEGPIRVELDKTGIVVEASMRGKQRKPEELTPHLFIVFPLDSPSEAHYIVDKRGHVIREPVGHKIMAGDRLVWEILDSAWLREITILVARLSADHHRRLMRDVFQAINGL